MKYMLLLPRLFFLCTVHSLSCSSSISGSILPVVQLWLDLSGTAISPEKVRQSLSLPQGIFPDKVILSPSLDDDDDNENTIGSIWDESTFSEKNTTKYDENTNTNACMNHKSRMSLLAKHYETLLQAKSVVYKLKSSHEKDKNPIKKSVLISNNLGEDTYSCAGYMLHVLSDDDDKDSNTNHIQQSTILTTAVDIISSGQWVILENNNQIQEKNSILSDLVPLIISFLFIQNNLPITLGGGVTRHNNTNNRGGLGIKCKTVGDLITWGSLLQSAMINVSSSSSKHASLGEMTTSDILVLETDTTKVIPPIIDIALVLPFDYEIWASTPGIRY